LNTKGGSPWLLPHRRIWPTLNTASAWAGFTPGLWQKEINVRDFIQQNYEPYEGNASFLAPATERTKNLWAGLNELFVEERKKGVLDLSGPQFNHVACAGYIDRANEIISLYSNRGTA
jgi:formate C-acetyltransferase